MKLGENIMESDLGLKPGRSNVWRLSKVNQGAAFEVRSIEEKKKSFEAEERIKCVYCLRNEETWFGFDDLDVFSDPHE